MVLLTGIRRASSLLRKDSGREEGNTRRIFRLYFVFWRLLNLLLPLPAGYQDLGKLTKKLSKEEVNSLLVKLDTDGDGQLSFDEFKVLFENAEKRKKVTEKKSQENLIRHHSAKVGAVPVCYMMYLEACNNVCTETHKTLRSVEHSFK